MALPALVSAQVESKEEQEFQNTAQRLMEIDKKLTIGGYAQIDYNQGFGEDYRQNGQLDVHRVVMMFGYKFNDRTHFFTEIEYEHISEVYIEQAFLNYKINDFIDFRGGLMLIPMGIMNEYHEPPTFNGVERPLVDKYIAPTTWREIGAGFTGNFVSANLKYQLYVVNGFSSYNDGQAKLNGKKGLRSGRQKGAESFMSSPNLTARIEYYGLPSLSLGLSGYFGETQSTLYDGLDKDDELAEGQADSSVVGISMIGLDARFQKKGVQLRGQFYYTALSNTDQYNHFTGSETGPNDLGSAMVGYYLEAGYNVFQTSNNIQTELIPFVRYEGYNTHQSVESGFEENKSYNNTIITTGIGWKLTPGAVLKADLQFLKSEADDDYSKVFNAGIGIMF